MLNGRRHDRAGRSGVACDDTVSIKKRGGHATDMSRQDDEPFSVRYVSSQPPLGWQFIKCNIE